MKIHTPAKLLAFIFKRHSLNIPKVWIEREFVTHPSAPSLLAVSDLLEKLNIKHTVYKLSREHIEKSGADFLSLLKNGEYIWIKQVNNDKIYYTDSNLKKHCMAIELFVPLWTQSGLIINDVSKCVEPSLGIEEHLEIEKEYIAKWGIAVIFVLILFPIVLDFCLVKREQQLLWALQIIYMVGGFISYLTKLYEKDSIQNSFIQTICVASKYIDCKKVIYSNYSKIGHYISLPQLEFVYFVSSFFYCWFAIIFQVYNFSALFVWSLLPLPLTVLLLGIQLTKLKKLCTFCCFSILLLWGVALLLYKENSLVYDWQSVRNICLLFFLFIISLLISILLNESERLIVENQKKQRRIYQFKYDSDFVRNKLSKEFYPDLKELGYALGNSSSELQISFFISLNCPNCQKVVALLGRVLKIFPDISYNLILNNDGNKGTDTLIEYLTALYFYQRENFLSALQICYDQPANKKMTVVKQTYPLNKACVKSWKIDNKLPIKELYTPAMFLNGRLVPVLFNVNDYYYLIRLMNYELLYK